MQASEKLIEVNRRTAKILRQRAVDKYYENPNCCLNCGDILRVGEKQKVADVRANKFCDKSCAAQYNNRLYPKRKRKSVIYVSNPQDKKGKQRIKPQAFRECKECSEIFEVGRYPSGSVRQKTLCDSCLFIVRQRHAKKTAGDNALPKPIEEMTKAELRLAKNNNPFKFKTLITNHARRVFDRSKREKKCVICSYDKFCEVCHIHDVSEFGEDELIGHINHITNLIPLCPNHHKEFDKHLLDDSANKTIAVLAQLAERRPSKP